VKNWVDLQDELTAYLRGELDPGLAAEIEAFVASDLACAAEVEELRETLDLVRSTLTIEPHADHAARLMAAVDAALLENPVASEAPEVDADTPILRPSFGQRLGTVYEYAQYRYRNSSGFRRFVSASLVAHAAAVVIVAWVIFDDAAQTQRPNISWGSDSARTPWDPMISPDDVLFERPDGLDGTVGVIENTPLPPFESASAEGMRPQPPVDHVAGTLEGTELRYPTISVMLKYRAVFDHAERTKQARMHAGPHAARAMQSIEDGLNWLSTRRHKDGTWAPTATASKEVRTGVTAAVLLAMSHGGRSAAHGTHATLLQPAVRHLEAFVEKGYADADVAQPLYPFTLALRALSVAYALDYPHLDTATRNRRKSMLARGGARLVSWQLKSGGFGYTAKTARADASCTLFAAAALTDLRTAGIFDTRSPLEKAGRYLSGNLRDDGVLDYQLARDRDGDLALTAALLSLHRELGMKGRKKSSLLRIKRALRTLKGSDGLLLAAGTEALRRYNIPIEQPIGYLVKSQRKDGSWSGTTDRHLRQGGDELVTAFGVLGLSRAYVRPY